MAKATGNKTSVVVGAGVQGSTVALSRPPTAPPHISSDSAQLNTMRSLRANPRNCPSAPFPRPTSGDGHSAVEGYKAVLLGIPSPAIRGVLLNRRSAALPNATIVSLAEGFEEGTQLQMTVVIHNVVTENEFAETSPPKSSQRSQRQRLSPRPTAPSRTSSSLA